MPIRPELRKFYGRHWRDVVRPRILKRAKDRCEQCFKLNHSMVWTVSWKELETEEPRMAWSVTGKPPWRLCTRRLIPFNLGPPPSVGRLRQVWTVLTVAHLNHVPGDDRDDNLKALCGWCHLNYDKLHHAEVRKDRKNGERGVLALAAVEA